MVTAVGSVAFALPGISFAILAGLLFGPVLGTICCTVAATLGAVAAFLLGRYFLKDTVGAAARKNPYLRLLQVLMPDIHRDSLVKEVLGQLPEKIHICAAYCLMKQGKNRSGS